MESIIKISSEQGFAESWVPADVATAPPTQKLLDFIIPGNTGTYDLGKCWINVNAEVVPKANANEGSITGLKANSTALYNNDIVAETDVAGSNRVCGDFASIVRNADMFSANRGMVESISRVNTLRQLLFNIENDKAEQHDGNMNLGTFLDEEELATQHHTYFRLWVVILVLLALLMNPLRLLTHEEI